MHTGCGCGHQASAAKRHAEAHMLHVTTSLSTHLLAACTIHVFIIPVPSSCHVSVQSLYICTKSRLLFRCPTCGLYSCHQLHGMWPPTYLYLVPCSKARYCRHIPMHSRVETQFHAMFSSSSAVTSHGVIETSLHPASTHLCQRRNRNKRLHRNAAAQNPPVT